MRAGGSARRRAWAALAAALALAPAPALADLLGAACPGPGAAAILLMPEEAGRLDDAPLGALTVTGAYTGADRRAEDRPRPVGVFVHAGRTISLELARMDGLLVVGRDGAARIAEVRAAPLGGTVHDLRGLDGRMAFARAAAEAGASAFQSHLLIRDGALDLRELPAAPRAPRRLLLEDAEGRLILWGSGARPLTLHEAATEALAAHAPRMALNLDMGTWDFCERMTAGGAISCGLLGREGTARLSNLLRLFADPACRPR